MIGMVDSGRASRVMEDLLAAVTKGHARFAILPLTLASLRDGLSMAIRRMAQENLGTTASAGAGRPRKE